MTTNNDAAKALDLLAKEIFDYRDSPSTPKTIQKAIDEIRTALTKSAKVDGLLEALAKVQTISAHMQSKRSFDLNKIATDAIQRFNGEG